VAAFERFGSGDQDRNPRRFEQVIGSSPALEAVLEQVERVAPTDSTVLIQGETGTGKELIARAIHNLSSRCGRSFIKLNCAAIPLDLLESELFGHEKGAFTGATQRRMGRFELAAGGTAVGTGLNAEPQYPPLMLKHLRSITGVELREGKDRVQLMQSMGDAAAFSGALRTYAVDLGKIASDLRLLASGPRTGLAEIVLPAVQPGSSIMPGKVNPSIPEMVNMVCFQVIGNDVTVATAAEAGQLELNVMMPVIAHNVLAAMLILGNATRVLADRCVEGIEADAAQCAHWLERSPALVTALAPKIGYAEAAKLAKEAVAKNVTVRQLVIEKGLLKGKELDEVLDLRAMTELGVPGERK